MLKFIQKFWHRKVRAPKLVVVLFRRKWGGGIICINIKKDRGKDGFKRFVIADGFNFKMRMLTISFWKPHQVMHLLIQEQQPSYQWDYREFLFDRDSNGVFCG